jgi:hypothetical protein
MKRFLALALLLMIALAPSAVATPWAEKEGYGEKTKGKLAFGLRNTFLGWTEMFSEPKRYKFDLKKSEWEGFCMGISKFVFYTADGLIQLATFPIPVDFPDFGEGAVPNLGKKKEGPPKPWEVHGKSRYSVIPASEVPATIRVTKAKSPAPVPPPIQTPPTTPTYEVGMVPTTSLAETAAQDTSGVPEPPTLVATPVPDLPYSK